MSDKLFKVIKDAYIEFDSEKGYTDDQEAYCKYFDDDTIYNPVDFYAGYMAALQPKHETVEQLEELKEENTDLNISIRKVTDQRDMAINALEVIKVKFPHNNQTELYREQQADIYFIAYNTLSKLKDNQDGE